MKFKSLVVDDRSKQRRRHYDPHLRYTSTAKYVAHEGMPLHVRFGKAKLASGPQGTLTLPSDGGTVEPDMVELGNIFCTHSVRDALKAEAVTAGIGDKPRMYLVEGEDGDLYAVISKERLYSDMTGINLMRGGKNQAFCNRNKRLTAVMYERYPFRGGLTVALVKSVFHEQVEGYTRDGGVVKAPALVWTVQLMSLDDLLYEATVAGLPVMWPSWYREWAAKHRPERLRQLNKLGVQWDQPWRKGGEVVAEVPDETVNEVPDEVPAETVDEAPLDVEAAFGADDSDLEKGGVTVDDEAELGDPFDDLLT